jgi:hypothetical protein
MADKNYHQQPCFCLPCKALIAEGGKPRKLSTDQVLEKPKKKGRDIKGK